MALDPAETIRLHYALISSRRYDEGYALMDRHLRSANSLADYRGWFVNKVSLNPLSIIVVSQTASAARVDTVVDSTDRQDGKVVNQQVAERFVLRIEDGAWRIDQVTRLS